MFFDYLKIAIPIFCLCVNVLVQIFIFRYMPNLGLLKSEYLGFGVGFVGILLFKFYIFLFHLRAINDFILIFIVDLMTYSALGYCYFHFVNLGETARRIRILRELYDAKEGLTIGEILERYNAQNIVQKRIDRLLNTEQIIIRNDRFYISHPTMLFIAKIITAMKLILLGKKRIKA